jgi:hypothetical protein
MEIIKGNLYVSKDLGVIVMAEQRVGENTFSGQVVVDGGYVKGFFSDNWSIRKFEPYSAEIILKEVIDFNKVQFVEMNSGDIVLTRGISDEYTFSCISVKTGIFCTWIKEKAKRVVTPKFE